jgi:drug/metabolite transporter (DMT)-like permease
VLEGPARQGDGRQPPLSGENLVIATPAALGAAIAFSVSSVLQQRSARDAPENESLSWRLIADLLRRGPWLAGMGCVLIAYALQALALAFGPVALVEPLIATELLFAVPLASRLRHQRLGRREWFGAAAVSGGVAVFLVVSSPEGGNAEPALARWAVVALPALVAAAIAIAAARGPESPRRAALLAAAAGLSFGLLALVTQSFVVLLARSPGTAFSSWQPYVLAVVGIVGFTVAQSAYQAAPLAVSLPIIDSVEPVTSVLFAALIFKQSLSISVGSLAGEVAGALLTIAGVVALARSPLILAVLARQERADRADHRARPGKASRR